MSALAALLSPWVVRLAQSPSSKRGRVQKQLQYGDPHAQRLTDTISRLRLASYRQRLSELGKQLGVSGGVPNTLDRGVVAGIAADSRRAAAGIVKSHNKDLKTFLASQPTSLSQAELGKAARSWERNRVSYKTKQIAQTEAARARNAALSDVLSRNRLSPKVRAIPEDAAEPECEALVSEGWMPSDDAPDLPLHPWCVHEYETEDLSDLIAGKSRVWLGASVDVTADEEGEDESA